MDRYSWSGGIDDEVTLEVVACRGRMIEQPEGLIVNRENNNNGGAFIKVDADERFLVLLRVNGVNIARLPPYRVFK